MTLLPDPWWPTIVLAVVIAADAGMSLKPPGIIRDCLDRVRFPRDWWWTLIVIKLTAATGLVAGLWVPGVALAANVGVVAYFACAAVAHVRARFLGQSFWLNCLGLLALALVVPVVSL
ncbi:DoxX family protein [Pseudoclavibacter sp. RFBA6]|uniref:DoxX family protein n=1 Tax=Pseudoclavibacter sp. RFBA6 TaxID=2080573 RepID=UPI000CE87AB8|nr:DoxX family protein [Pseudoclavibacter sp. RFBA6]PPG39133.1 hypothetical protein C5C17_09925 [Pseudoclavibacter sp. RFBA6]